MENLNHIYINQAGTEEVPASTINKLAQLADKELDETSDIIGSIHTDRAFGATVEKVKSKFPNLEITADETTIIDVNRTDSEEMAANDRALMDVIYAQGWSSNPDSMTKSEASIISDSSAFGSWNDRSNVTHPFYNSTIKEFSAFKYFNSLTAISTHAFHGLSNLISINLPESVDLIGGGNSSNGFNGGAFKDCNQLTTINTDKVKYFGPNAFRGCSSLRTIDLSAFEGGFSNEILLVKGEDDYRNKMTKGLLSPRLFMDCNSLCMTELPDGVEVISYNVFTNTQCNFTKLPNSVKSQDSNNIWFANTTGTQTHPLYNGYIVSWSGYKTSEDALGKENIDNDYLKVEEGVVTLKRNQTLGINAFYNNINIKEVHGVNVVCKNAFEGCTSLTNVIGNSGIADNSDNLFKGCSGLKTITDDIWNLFNNTIGFRCFDSCRGLAGTMIIPEKITTVKAYFMSSTNIRKVVLPSTLTAIGPNFLDGNKRLADVNMNYITDASNNTAHFNSCVSLKYIEFNRLNSITASFFNCTNGIKVCYFNQNTVPAINNNPVIHSSKKQLRFYVPIGMKSQYVANSKWNTVADRIIEASSAEMELIKKSLYGVTMMNDKYYDTKRKPTNNTRLCVEFDVDDDNNVLCGCQTSNNISGRFWYGIWNSGINSYVHGINYGGTCDKYSKCRAEFTVDHLKVIKENEVTFDGAINAGGIPDLNVYLGCANFNGIPWSNVNNFKMTGTIYRFFWYESDALVQAWIGNENGGFDIYANEDIELQENDRKFALSEYSE